MQVVAFDVNAAMGVNQHAVTWLHGHLCMVL